VVGPLEDGSSRDLLARLHRAHARRAMLAQRTNCYRVHDANSDEIADLTVERHAEFAVLIAQSKAALQASTEAAKALQALGARGVYLKVRQRQDPRKANLEALAPRLPIAGEPAAGELAVNECGRRFLVRLDDGLATGLFVDQRDNRTRLSRACHGLTVLNLFCYTGSFSVAAGLGRAARVVSVDSSKSALARADENLRLNALPKQQHRLLHADARQWLERAVRRVDRFDWIILDPPSFSAQRTFRVEEHYDSLLEHCFRLLNPGGRLLAVTNHRATTRARFRARVERAATRTGREFASLAAPEPPMDCPLGNQPERATKSLLARVR
jgi:23S rRNA (cytosine1962-C5)-methyltransferase